MEDAEQLRILPASTQSPWMEPLSGMNGALCYFGGAVKQAWKIQVNSPMRLGLKIRHGDRQTWPSYELWATNPLQEDCACWRCWKEKPERLTNSLFISCRSLDVLLSLAVSTSRSFTDWTFTDHFIMVLYITGLQRAVNSLTAPQASQHFKCFHHNISSRAARLWPEWWSQSSTNDYLLRFHWF